MEAVVGLIAIVNLVPDRHRTIACDVESPVTLRIKTSCFKSGRWSLFFPWASDSWALHPGYFPAKVTVVVSW